MGMMAQSTVHSMPADGESCEYWRRIQNAPHYYCACHEEAIDFSFPLELEISDTTWIRTSFNDVARGFTAYWFADCAVTIEVYVFCVSYEPAVKMTIGANNMEEMDLTQINQRLEEAGESATELINALTPRVRVYPKGGGKGKAYIYPFGQGPHSTCEQTLPLLPELTYVCDQPENVYRLAWQDIDPSGKAFVRWKEEDAKACEVWLTKGACEGEEIGRAVLTDSMHVYQPKAERLIQAREEKQDIWLHIRHEKKITGRLFWTLQEYELVEEKQDVERVLSDPKQAHTYIKNGQLYIRINNDIYTLLGQKITN